MDINERDMLMGGPIGELLETLKAELDEANELGAGSVIAFERARLSRLVREKVEEARRAAPECDTATAAEIMAVSPRQARNIAAAGKVKARRANGSDTGDWIFDVRSCHAYARHKGDQAA